MINLLSIPKDFIAKHGREKTVEITGTTVGLVSQWESGSKPASLEAVQKMLDYDPDPIHAVKPLYGETPVGERLAILMTTNRAVQWNTMASLIKLYESNKMQFMIEYTNFLVRGRNQLAHRFLQSDCEWSLWVDDDIVLPCSDAAWFKRMTSSPSFPDTYAGLNTIGRLLSHQKKLIGGCYFGRFPNSRAQFNDAYLSPMVDDEIHVGPKNEIRKTKWIAAGAMLVHRDVFMDIARTQPEIKLKSQQQMDILKYQYGFFDPLEGGQGEDVAFCLKAEKAGHPAFVDLAVMPAHIGQCAYNFFNTRKTT